MSGEQTSGDLLREIAEEIGFQSWLTNAAWGRRFADLLYATGEEEAIKRVLADGAEGIRSKYLSETRRKARDASAHIVASESDADARAWIAQQLSFEVCAPGFPPMPLRDATHQIIAAAYLADLKKLQGHVQNNLQLKRAMDLTAAHPDQTVGELMTSGVITAAELAVERAA